MYQVYSQLRPGRPRWTLAANAFVLLLTVGLAAGVSNYKRRALQITLDKPSVSTRYQIRVRLPQGWNVNSDADLPAGIAFIADEAGQRSRRVIIFRDKSRPLGLPSQQGVLALQAMCARHDVIFGRKLKSAIAAALKPSFESEGSARLGVLPAWDGAALYGFDEETLVMLKGRVGVGPDGQVAGILIASTGDTSARDSVLLDQLSQDFELLDTKPLSDTSAAMKLAGIEFELPGGVTVFSEQVSPTSTIQLMGGSGEGAWYLDIARAPLLPGRTPDALLRDWVQTSVDATELPKPISTNSVNGKTILQMQLGNQSTSVVVALCQQDEQTAVFVQGRCEEEGLEELQQVAERILTQARVAPYTAFVDLKAAQQRGREYLDKLKTAGLHSIWGRYQAFRQGFVLRSASQLVGASTREIRRNRRDGGMGWEYRLEDVVETIKTAEVWDLSDDLLQHTYEYDSKSNTGGFQYTEKRENAELTRTLSEEGKPAGLPHTTPIDETYASEPVLIAAAAHVATMPADKTGAIVVSSTQNFTVATHAWVIVPVGKLNLPGGSEQAATAALLRDFDPRPIYLYFAPDQTLWGVKLPSDRIQVRVRHAVQENE